MPAVVVAVPATNPTPPPMPTGCAKVNIVRIAGRPLVRSAFCGHKMTPVEMVATFRRAGVPWGPQMTNAVKTALAESDGYTKAIYFNRDPRTGAVLSTDTGWLQINDHWHPEIVRNRYDPLLSARIAWSTARRYGWSVWHGFVINGSKMTTTANRYIAQARYAGVR